MIREAAVAGQFYPSRPESLRKEIGELLRPVRSFPGTRAVMVPHAGYVYSGPVAGAVYASVDLPRRFILLGPNHTGLGARLSLYPSGEWRTPLGTVWIDPELTGLLERNCPHLRPDRQAHLREHSLEVQIPFLQVRVPDFRFAAICVGTGEYPVLADLGQAIARILRDLEDPPLIVSSSDMSHYESASVASAKDHLAIERILAVDPAGLHEVVHRENISMCGFAPTTAALAACRELGCRTGHLVRYSNSGDVSGDYDRVVGYAGIAVH